MLTLTMMILMILTDSSVSSPSVCSIIYTCAVQPGAPHSSDCRCIRDRQGIVWDFLPTSHLTTQLGLLRREKGECKLAGVLLGLMYGLD